MATLSKIAKGGKTKKKGPNLGIAAALNIESKQKLEVKVVPTLFIMPNPDPLLQQPRTEFDDEMIEALAKSLKVEGQIYPILVSPAETNGEYAGKYFIQDGECRWRAAKLAGLTEMQVYVNPRKLSQEELLLIQLASNEQRNSLKVFELALSIKRLIDLGMTLVDIADQMGKPRSYVTDLNRLNTAPEYLCDYFRRTKFRDTNSIGLLATAAARDPERFKALFQRHLEEDTEDQHVTRRECLYIRDVIANKAASTEAKAEGEASLPTNTPSVPVASTETASDARSVPPSLSEAEQKAQEAARKREEESWEEIDRYQAEVDKDPDVRESEYSFLEEEVENKPEPKPKTVTKPKEQSRWEMPDGAMTLSNLQALCYRVKVRCGDVYRHGTLMSIVTLAEKGKQAFLYQGKVTSISNDQIVAIEGSVMADQVRSDDDCEEAA